jgi:hypothetical protein
MAGRPWIPVVAAVALATSLALLLAALGPALTPDSPGYLNGAPYRPPVVYYAAAPWVALLGRGPGLRVFVAFQVLVGFGTAALLASTLQRFLRLGPLAGVVALPILFLPQIQAARAVMSESLAYSAVCVFVSYLLRVLAGSDSRGDLALLWAGAALAALTRIQFYFLILPALIATGAALWRAREWARRLTAAGTVAGVLALAFAMHASYTVPRAGRFERVPFAGLQLFAVALHIAEPEEIAAIPEAQVRHVAERAYAKAGRIGCLASQRERLTPSMHFHICYNPIVEAIMDAFDEETRGVRLGRQTWDDLQGLLPVENWYDLDATTLLASRGLLRHSYRRYVAFVLRSCFEHHRYYALLAGTLFALTLIGAGLRSRTRLLLLTASGLWLVNLAVVASVEIPQMRYTFYFDGLLLAAVVLALMSASREAEPSRAASASGSGA